MGQVTPPFSSPPPAGTILATNKPSRGMLDIIPINIIYKLTKTYFSPLLSEIDLIHFTQTCIALFNLRLHQGILPSLTLKVLPPATESLLYTINEKLPTKDKEGHWVPWVCRRVGKTIPFLQKFTLHLVPIANTAERANFTQKLGAFVKLTTLNLHFIDEQEESKTTEDYLLALFSLKNLSTLNTLTLNSPSLTQLPKELSLLPSLKVLDLSGCSSLTTFSEEFNKKTQIEIRLPSHLHVAPASSLVVIPLAYKILPLLPMGKPLGADSFFDNASSTSATTRSSTRSFYSSLVSTEANTATTSSVFSLSSWDLPPSRLRSQSFAKPLQVFQPQPRDFSSDPEGIYWRENGAFENNNTGFLSFIASPHVFTISELNLIKKEELVNSLIVKVDKEDSFLLQEILARKNFSSLKYLTILGDIQSLPQGLGNLPSLINLTIEGNMKALPNGIGELLELYYLTIKGDLPELPQGMGNMPKLRELSIEGNMKALPNGIGKFLELYYLRIKGDLPELPQGLGNMPNLRELTIEGNIIDLSSGLGLLPKIKILTINNKAIDLSRGLDNLSDLRSFNIESVFPRFP